jgi:cell division protein FtsW (lipid II flippase)
MGKNEVFWGIISFVLILIAYLVPYTVLSEVAKWYGSFLFWILIAVVIVGVNYVLTRDWRDE